VKIPENEKERLKTLRLYNILDTAAEKTFDDLTRLAATICEAPISLVSLVDEKRQWFKSKVGLEVTETPREHAFCAHTILKDELMIVEDATSDLRFQNNPLVTDNPNIRFYAGAPLELKNGIRLGTLCIIDRKPRQLTSHQKESLKILREAVVTQLEYKRAQHDLTALENLLPMCSWCRSVRVEDGDGETWHPVHEYIMDITTVTHGICPSCKNDLE